MQLESSKYLLGLAQEFYRQITEEDREEFNSYFNLVVGDTREEIAPPPLVSLDQFVVRQNSLTAAKPIITPNMYNYSDVWSTSAAG